MSTPPTNFTLGTIRQKTVEATALEQILCGQPTRPNDTIIRGLGFAHYADAALIVGAPRVRLETIPLSGMGCREPSRESNGTLGISNDTIVGGNTFSYNGLSGLRGDRAPYAT